MSYTLNVTLTQPTPTITWSDFIDNIDNHIKTTYRDPGKIEHYQINISNDNLTYQAEIIFQNQEMFDIFWNDPVIIEAVHNRNNLINSVDGTIDISVVDSVDGTIDISVVNSVDGTEHIESEVN